MPKCRVISPQVAANFLKRFIFTLPHRCHILIRQTSPPPKRRPTFSKDFFHASSPLSYSHLMIFLFVRQAPKRRPTFSKDFFHASSPSTQLSYSHLMIFSFVRQAPKRRPTFSKDFFHASSRHRSLPDFYPSDKPQVAANFFKRFLFKLPHRPHSCHSSDKPPSGGQLF